MVKATTTIRQVLNHQAEHAAWFAASLVIGQRLVARYQKPFKEKPHTHLKAGRAEQSAGVVISQVAKSGGDPAIHRKRKAWGSQRAWHRSRWIAQDG